MPPAAASATSAADGMASSYSMLFSPDAASSLASPTVELEVRWDPSTIRWQLRSAVTVLSQRCLKLAAKWAADQLMGLTNGDSSGGGSAKESPSLGYHSSSSTGSVGDPNANKYIQEVLHLQDRDMYAKSLLELGEYLHAAAILSEPNDDVSKMSPPLTDLSMFGTYLRAYSLYMAGERRKEQDHLELKSEAQKHKSTRNPYLSQLLEELYNAHELHKLDAFGLYVYGLVLKEARKEKLTCSHEAHAILVESILLFPYNWSAWLDLSDVALEDTAIEQQVEQALQPNLATHFMYHFFCAHSMAEHHQAHEDALVLYERLFEPMPGQRLFQSSYLKSQLGVVHYHLREFELALDCFSQIQDPFLLEHKDVYSNILYVKEDRVGLSQLAHQAVMVDKYRPETCCIVGNYYSLRQQRQKAVLYFQRALKLDRSYTSAWTLMGHEYVELKQTESAMEAYRRAVTVSPKDYRAWYGLGQTYEFLNMHLYALFYYRKASMLRPYDSRMWCALGLCFVALHRTADAIRAYERAVAQEDTEGIATQKLASLYRQEGRLEEAAQCYLRHLELRYLVTSANPHQHHPPTLDEMVQKVIVEAPEAEALMFLANYYKSNGEYDTASLLCSRLVEYPGPEKEQAKGLLRDIRSRAKTSTGRRMHTRSLGPPPSGNLFEFSP